MKRIIILERTTPWNNQGSVKYALWADVPAAHQIKYAKDPTWKSEYSDADSAELTALRSGAVVEKIDVLNFSTSETVASLKNTLQNRFTDFQNQITNENTWQFYGTFYDGTAWTTGGL